MSRPFDSGLPEVAGPVGRWPMDGQLAHFQAMLSDPDQTYDLAAVPPSSLIPGDWAVEAPGGTDIAAFRIPLRIAPPLRWLNRDAVRVARSADFTLAWDPAGYTGGERVRAGLSWGLNGISCEAPATAGSITIPAALIERLPADPRGPAMASLLFVPSNLTPSLYSLPLREGGVVRGLATFSYLESVTVTWE